MKPRLFRDQYGAYSTETLTYAQWLEAASNHRDQNFIWREHERYARINERHRRDAHWWYDLGGEA